MNAVIKGAKKGEGKARKAVIAPDSAQSKTYIKILYGLSEGEVEGLANGLQSVYLEETPLHNPSGGSNFQDIQFDFRHGTNDQTHIEGFPDISSETAINVELVSGTPWVRAISNTDLDAVRIRFKWGPLRQQNADNGDVKGITIQYAIDLQTNGGTWTEVLNTQISDKTSANYERSHRIDLPKSDSGWTIRVRRITPNSSSEYISDKMYVDALTEVIDLKLSYPNTALLGLQYDAETFSNVAKVAVDLKGIKLQVPSNYDPVARTYTGMWDGTFKRAYTNNPAWIYYDICTSKRYALGDRLTSAMLDKWSLYRLAQYCDQMVSDGKGGQEPRFTCNVYLQSTEDAFAILTKLSGVFRAISYWDGNAIVCDADIPQDTYFTYTRANVADGIFEYSGTRARDRHTVAKVAWDNPANHYKTEYVYVRDEPAIAKLGVRIAEIDAWGCTSEGQAQRAGLWALKSEQLEVRSVSFKVGLDGYIPQPGKVIEIADELFAGRANGGRISAVSADRKIITLDRDDVVCRAGDRLVVNGEDGKAQARIVSSKIGRKVTVAVAFDSVAAENVWVVDAQDLKTMKFRVMSITQDEKHQFSITALQYESAKYDAIDFGAFIDERPISIINPTTQAPVESVSITSETMVQQGLAVETMVISWPQAQGATKYQVEWRKDDGAWIKLPITGNNSAEVQGIYAGNYEARVTAISAFDVASLPTYSILTTLSGKQGLPPALANIAATGILFGYRLNWNFPATGALDTAYTEIEIASTANGANAAQLGLFAYPTNSHVIQGMQPNLTRYFRGRLIDRIGNIGPWSQYASATTSADASAVLDILSGKITESQLHQDLQTKIDKIDAAEGDIADLIVAVQNVENGVTQERNERIAGDNQVLNQLTIYKVSNDQAVAAVVEEVEILTTEQGALSTKIDGVFAQVNPPLIGSESDLIGNNAGYAGVWSEQSARIEGDLVQAKRTDTVQTELNGNIAAVQEVTQSVNGLYAQKFIKLDVNGKLAGWGGANNGVESQFIFNFDSIAIGNGSNTAVTYPYIFRTTSFTDPVTGTVFPPAAYLKSAMMDYQSVKTSHIEDLAVKTAKIANAAITTAKIGDLQVDTLKIKDNAVTVPVGVSNPNIVQTTGVFLPQYFDFTAQLTEWEAKFSPLATITLNRQGGQCRFDASCNVAASAYLTAYAQDGGNLSENDRLMLRLVLSVYKGSVLVGRAEVPPTQVIGQSGFYFEGALNALAIIDTDNTIGTTTYTLKLGFANRGSRAIRVVLNHPSGVFGVNNIRFVALELKK
ncbi:host specificity protein J [Acinetobacter junii]|uniref:host specificity protein J n=1 Tax=Acinetobacter junii TaxID=40215 RepID=UPI003FA2A028